MSENMDSTQVVEIYPVCDICKQTMWFVQIEYKRKHAKDVTTCCPSCAFHPSAVTSKGAHVTNMNCRISVEDMDKVIEESKRYYD
jgi:hypothetical protein